jgi:hypothetical protein
MCLLIQVRFNPRCYQEAHPQRDEKPSLLFELRRLLTRFDQVASRIVNANNSIM